MVKPGLVSDLAQCESRFCLWQMCQDCRCVHPIAGVLADVTPHDATVCINDEHGRRGQAVAQQIVHAVGLGHAVLGIGQHGIAHPCPLAPPRHDVNGCHHQ